MYNPIVSMRNARETGVSHPEDALGPYRPIRAGETVREADVTDASGIPMVPERIYGGRRRKGPLPDGVPTDRRQRHNAIRRI